LLHLSLESASGGLHPRRGAARPGCLTRRIVLESDGTAALSGRPGAVTPARGCQSVTFANLRATPPPGPRDGEKARLPIHGSVSEFAGLEHLHHECTTRTLERGAGAARLRREMARGTAFQAMENAGRIRSRGRPADWAGDVRVIREVDRDGRV